MSYNLHDIQYGVRRTPIGDPRTDPSLQRSMIMDPRLQSHNFDQNEHNVAAVRPSYQPRGQTITTSPTYQSNRLKEPGDIHEFYPRSQQNPQPQNVEENPRMSYSEYLAKQAPQTDLKRNDGIKYGSRSGLPVKQAALQKPGFVNTMSQVTKEAQIVITSQSNRSQSLQQTVENQRSSFDPYSRNNRGYEPEKTRDSVHKWDVGDLSYGGSRGDGHDSVSHIDTSRLNSKEQHIPRNVMEDPFYEGPLPPITKQNADPFGHSVDLFAKSSHDSSNDRSDLHRVSYENRPKEEQRFFEDDRQYEKRSPTRTTIGKDDIYRAEYQELRSRGFDVIHSDIRSDREKHAHPMRDNRTDDRPHSREYPLDESVGSSDSYGDVDTRDSYNRRSCDDRSDLVRKDLSPVSRNYSRDRDYQDRGDNKSSDGRDLANLSSRYKESNSREKSEREEKYHVRQNRNTSLEQGTGPNVTDFFPSRELSGSTIPNVVDGRSDQRDLKQEYQEEKPSVSNVSQDGLTGIDNAKFDDFMKMAEKALKEKFKTMFEGKTMPSPENAQKNIDPKNLVEPNREESKKSQIKKKEHLSPESKKETPKVLQLMSDKDRKKAMQSLESKEKMNQMLKETLEKLYEGIKSGMSKERRDEDVLKEQVKMGHSLKQQLAKVQEDYKNLREKLVKDEELRVSNSTKTHSPLKESSNSKADRSTNRESSPDVEYFDPGNHWCKMCNNFSDTAIDHLAHLQSASHKEKANMFADRPWSKLRSDPVLEGIGINLKPLPFNGTEFLMSVNGFFCKLCNEFSGDVADGEFHLNSKNHNKNYQKYLSEHKSYKQRFQLEKTAGLQITKKSFKPQTADRVEYDEDTVSAASSQLKKTFPKSVGDKPNFTVTIDRALDDSTDEDMQLVLSDEDNAKLPKKSKRINENSPGIYKRSQSRDKQRKRNDSDSKRSVSRDRRSRSRRKKSRDRRSVSKDRRSKSKHRRSRSRGRAFRSRSKDRKYQRSRSRDRRSKSRSCKRQDRDRRSRSTERKRSDRSRSKSRERNRSKGKKLKLQSPPFESFSLNSKISLPVLEQTDGLPNKRTSSSIMAAKDDRSQPIRFSLSNVAATSSVPENKEDRMKKNLLETKLFAQMRKANTKPSGGGVISTTVSSRDWDSKPELIFESDPPPPGT